MKSFPKQEKQLELFKKSLNTRHYQDEIPITGRSYINYSMQLFPDISTNKLVSYMGSKDYLDIACGINHLYPKSLLRMVKGSKKTHGLDIHSKSEGDYFKGTIYKTPFSNNSYDCITINNFLYFWEYNPDNLLKIYKELYRICKSNGEIRVFPVFFGNYYQDKVELFEYLNNKFSIQLIRGNDYSKEIPIYMDEGEIKKAKPVVKDQEYKLNHQLMAYTLVLHKR
tara:strand:- start:344 stop:1018 length:675 start_codon:yes stop_codon:yes gene_type:complete